MDAFPNEMHKASPGQNLSMQVLGRNNQPVNATEMHLIASMQAQTFNPSSAVSSELWSTNLLPCPEAMTHMRHPLRSDGSGAT